MEKRKGAVVGALAFFAVCAVIALIFLPQRKATYEPGDIYKNELYGYSITLPKSWGSTYRVKTFPDIDYMCDTEGNIIFEIKGMLLSQFNEFKADGVLGENDILVGEQGDKAYVLTLRKDVYTPESGAERKDYLKMAEAVDTNKMGFCFDEGFPEITTRIVYITETDESSLSMDEVKYIDGSSEEGKAELWGYGIDPASVPDGSHYYNAEEKIEKTEVDFENVHLWAYDLNNENQLMLTSVQVGQLSERVKKYAGLPVPYAVLRHDQEVVAVWEIFRP